MTAIAIEELEARTSAAEQRAKEFRSARAAAAPIETLFSELLEELQALRRAVAAIARDLPGDRR